MAIESTTPEATGFSKLAQHPLLKKLDSMLEWLGDRLNPILVKETRQAIKSKQFVIWFILLLIACWVVTIGAAMMIGPSIYYVSTGNLFLYAYYVILAFPLVIVVPFSAYRSLANEQESNTRDVLEVSTLTPRQIINGKLGSAMLQALVYLSALVPCIAFTYLLRGISTSEIALLLAYAMFASLGLSMIGLLFAAIAKQKRSQVALSLIFAALLFASLGALLFFSYILMFVERIAARGESGFWGFSCLLLSFYLTTFGLVYFATIGATTFVSANRSTALRIAALVQQLVCIAWIGGSFAYKLLYLPANVVPLVTGLEEMATILLIGIIYWYIAGSIMVGEQPQLSQRIRRTLPQTTVGRIFFTWLNPGPSSGYVFAVVNMTFLSLLFAFGLFLFYANNLIAFGLFVDVLIFTLLLWAYAVLYLGIGRIIVYGLRRITSFSLLGSFLVLLLLLMVGNVFPAMIESMFDSIRVDRYTLLQYPSPYWTLKRLTEGGYGFFDVLMLSITIVPIALVVLSINLAMAAYEAQQLRVAKPKRVKEDDRLLQQTPEQIVTNPWGDTVQVAFEEE